MIPSRALVLPLCVFAVLVSALLSFQHAEISAVLFSSFDLHGDKYQALLHREKSVLRSGPGGLDWGNRRFLHHASDEQQAYLADKNQKAMVAGQQAQKDAAKLFHKWANPYKGTVYAKYDTPVEDEDKSRTTQLAQDDTGAKLRQLAAVSLAKRREAQASCKGNAGCEKVLQQVLDLFAPPASPA